MVQRKAAFSYLAIVLSASCLLVTYFFVIQAHENSLSGPIDAGIIEDRPSFDQSISSDRENIDERTQNESLLAITRLPWNIDSQTHPLDLQRIADLIDVNEFDIYPLNIDFATLDRMESGDVVSVVLPGGNGKYAFKVLSAETNSDVRTITGHLDGYDKGYAVVVSYVEDSVFGTVTTPEGVAEIQTLYAKTVIFYPNPSRRPN